MRIFVTVCFFVLNFFSSKLDAKSCVFCREEIAINQSVFQSEHFRVVPSHEPLMKGHLLVIPKRHLVKAHELSKEEWEELSIVIPKVVEVFSRLLDTDQYIIFEKNGPKAFQDVPHVHFHLLPVISQTWGEIFDIIPKRLSKAELEEEVALFTSYFSLDII